MQMLCHLYSFALRVRDRMREGLYKFEGVAVSMVDRVLPPVLPQWRAYCDKKCLADVAATIGSGRQKDEAKPATAADTGSKDGGAKLGPIPSVMSVFVTVFIKLPILCCLRVVGFVVLRLCWLADRWLVPIIAPFATKYLGCEKPSGKTADNDMTCVDLAQLVVETPQVTKIMDYASQLGQATTPYVPEKVWHGKDRLVRIMNQMWEGERFASPASKAEKSF